MTINEQFYKISILGNKYGYAATGLRQIMEFIEDF